MHETRFVNEIFDVLRREIGEGRALEGAIVNVRLSPFSHVTSEGLQASFRELVKGENFKDIQLKILPLGILLECKKCKRSSRINKRVFGCPICKSEDVNIQMDKEFFVESIEIEPKERMAEDGN